VILLKVLLLFKYILSTITLIGLLLLAIIFFYFGNGINLSGFFKKEIILTNRQLAIVTLPPSEFHAWFASWDEKKSYESFRSNIHNLKSISPVWYKIDDEGKLLLIPHGYEGELKTLAQQSGLKINPTVTNDFDPHKTSVLLGRKDISDKLIDDLIHLAKDSGFSGFDIDFEEIDPRDQYLFEEFIETMAGKMHQENLTVSLSIPAQRGTVDDREVVKAYDIDKLSKNADFIKIMAYDFHSPGSRPGAIIPMDDLEKVLTHFTSIMPTSKIILGLPTYGYDWILDSDKRADVVTYAQAQEKIASYSGSLKRSSKSESLIGTYHKDNQAHEIWFQDAQTIKIMVEKARSYGINQFSFWRVGAEDPGIWQNITNSNSP
jgi:spore germination protein